MHIIVINVATLFVCFLLPFVVFLWPRIPKKPGSVLLRWGIVSIIGWLVLLIAGQAYGALWRREWRITGQVPAWDPVFTVALTAALGWVFPLVASVPFMLLRGIIDLVKARRHHPDEGTRDAEQDVSPNA